jgi:hypothetical protein
MKIGKAVYYFIYVLPTESDTFFHWIFCFNKHSTNWNKYSFIRFFGLELNKTYSIRKPTPEEAKKCFDNFCFYMELEEICREVGINYE